MADRLQVVKTNIFKNDNARIVSTESIFKVWVQMYNGKESVYDDEC